MVTLRNIHKYNKDVKDAANDILNVLEYVIKVLLMSLHFRCPFNFLIENAVQNDKHIELQANFVIRLLSSPSVMLLFCFFCPKNLIISSFPLLSFLFFFC